MNPFKTVHNLRGKEYPKSFPEPSEIEALPLKEIFDREKQGKIKVPDMDKLEKETVGNIIIMCLSFYRGESRKEGWYANLIAQSILSADKKKGVEFKEKIKKFLIEALEDSIIREVKEGEKGKEVKAQEGVYAGWVIVQCLEELGEKEER